MRKFLLFVVLLPWLGVFSNNCQTFDTDIGCSVCGNGLCIEHPTGIFEVPNSGFGAVPCNVLEQSGYSGLIPLSQCALIPSLITQFGDCRCGTNGYDDDKNDNGGATDTNGGGDNNDNNNNATTNSNKNTIFVEAPVGTLVGTSSDENGVDSFLGIPFATVNERFQASSLKETLEEGDQLQRDGPLCWQSISPIAEQYAGAIKFFPQSEDCLYMNIYRPTTRNTSSSSSSSKLPVMVWLHGGGWVLGGTAIGSDGTNFAKDDDVIFVSFNYRLGIFGYLPVKEEEDEEDDDDDEQTGTGSNMGTGGLNGIYDQIVALQWIRNNIASLGGDPQRVTIVGQSAGSVSACLLSASPLARGLFQRAILMSGHCLSPLLGAVVVRDDDDDNDNDDDDDGLSLFVSQLLNATGASSLFELRNATKYPPRDITDYTTHLDGFTLTYDDWVLPRDGGYDYIRNNFHIQEFMVGSTSYDDVFTSTVNVSYALEERLQPNNVTDWLEDLYDLYTTTRPKKKDTTRQLLLRSTKKKLLVSKKQFVQNVLEAYPSELYYNNEYLSRLQIYGDSFFACPMRQFAQEMANNNNNNNNNQVYLYNFAYLSDSDLRWGTGVMEAFRLDEDPSFASHGSEGGILFGNFISVGGFVDNPPEEDVRISQHMRKLWTRYAQTGNPNYSHNNNNSSSSSSSSDDDGVWEMVTQDDLNSFTIGIQEAVPFRNKPQQCSHFNELSNYYHSSVKDNKKKGSNKVTQKGKSKKDPNTKKKGTKKAKASKKRSL